ncbi:MAG: tetratricopeptide repeat protein, partial [Planctomycetaceae bacterium]|nr:tetratricopeptide repeat protein [Planctomycetaceae bacterium]
YSNKTRAELFLAAARNSSNMGEIPQAKYRYELYWELDYEREEARGEYAGVLNQLKDYKAAVQLLEGEELTAAESYLLAAIYSSQEDFTKATEIYRQLLAKNPDDQKAQVELANNYLWGKQYDLATPAFRRLVKAAPDNLSYRENLAQSLFLGQHFEEAFPLYTTLVKQHPEQTSYWNGFMLSAAKASVISSEGHQLIQSIFLRRGERSEDTEFLQLLLAAMTHIDDSGRSLIIMEELLALHPEDAQLRLRFADGLQAQGEYERAEENYQWLINHTVSPGRLRTTASPGVSESR